MDRRTLGAVRASLVSATLLLCAAAPAAASHFRGGNVNAQVSPAGIATLTYETLWRKGIAFFPFDGVGQIRLYNLSDTSRNSALRTVNVSIGDTTVFRDVSDPAFDFRRQVVTLNLAALGLPQGRYVARWENCCRIAGIQNAPESSFSLETLLVYSGTANGSPVLNSRILTVVGKGLPYGQNLNAFDPDGRALTYQFLAGSGRPTFGPTTNVPGMTLDAAGQVAIPATATAVLVDVNRFNPAGDYVFKVRVTDADGVFSERDVLLDVVATANRPPEIAPIGNRVLRVGESLVLPVSATDPNPLDRVTLRTSQLLANMVFLTSPGNPASGTFAFRPDASQVGTFGINVEASDNGSPVLTDSDLLTLTVLDPNNGCPVLAPVGNRDLVPGETLSLTLSATDPDPGQTLSFSASFLPPGASFDPATRTFTWTPGSGQTGVHLGTVFEVRDSASPPCPDREIVGFSVQPANRFPVLAPIGHRAAAEGSMITFTVDGTDPDGDALELAAEPLPLGALFDPANRLFQWRPALGQAGIYEITFRASDAGSPGLADEETVRITVGRAGEEVIRFAGLAEEQEVAGTILVEAQVTSPFPVVAVEFEIDGVVVNRDEAAPFFLGGEADGLPLGFGTAALQDGLHVLSATALDAAGQVTTAQRKFTSRNFVAPELMDLAGVFDGGVVSGVIEVEAHAIDDQQVAAVSFAIDGTAVNTETSAPYFLAGSRLPTGTFDVSCRVCLRVGDRDGDLVVAALEEDGTIARLCGATAGGSAVSRSHGSGTPDGVPPADEEICDALSGRAFGLCTAFCEAQDCDAPGHKESASCDQLRQNFARLTGQQRFPCEQLGGCIEHITLAVADDPSLVATFDHEDFSGAMTTFELPFPVPVGFDTTSLADGPHTLTITLTDNLGLTTVVDVHFDVQNGVLPPDALRVGLVEPAAGTYEAGRVLPVAAAVASAQGPVTVSFYANGRLLAADTEAPYQTALLLDGGSVTLHAVARDGRGPRQSPAVALAVLPRPAAPAPIEVLTAGPEDILDDRAAVTTTLRIVFSREVAAASLGGGIRLARGEEEVPLDLRLEPDRVTAIATPTSPLAPDALHVLTVVGVAADDGARAPRFTARFLTFPDVAIMAGRLLDGAERPIPGIAVRVGAVAGVSDSEGLFRLVGVPTGAQILHVEGGTVAGLTYPPLELALEVRPGIVENGVPRPIYLPALDLGGGLDVVGGAAVGSGILTSSALPGMALDLRGVTVLNGDGTLFTGRMSITPVPAPNVPMPPPVGVYSGSYVTIQPAVHLVPPAPITYPNLDGALPGEQIPLWHFDHGAFAWVHYGFGTVTGNGARIVSNPGQGLPETGWGSPQPPNTFTTVTGTVVDKEGSPLHGCRVVAGNVEGFSRNDGSFSLAQVPAGRQGSPVQIRVTVTAKDIEGMTYPGSSAPVTAVQNGTTDVGQVKIDSYGPVLEGKLKLHADFQDASRNHFLMVGSSHSAEMRYRREVEELQKRLMGHGFRQGGNNYDHGQPLVADGDYGDSTKKAVSLFQALELTPNGANGSVSNCGICTGVFREKSLAALNKIPPERQLWENAGPLAGLDYPCNTADPTGATPLIANGWGTFDMGSFLLGDLPVVPSDDISLPAGGSYRPSHASHQTGIDVDIPLPRRDNGGCPGTPGWGQISLNNASQRDNIYDRVAMRSILQGIADSGHATLVLLGDRVLCVDEGLCTLETTVHHNHLHVRINLSAIDGGALASTPLTAKPAPGLITSLLAPGAGDTDVPVDAALTATFAQAFDPTSLNASTVRLAGPEGEVQGDVVADPSGLAVRFKPALPLSFAVPYTFTVTTGAVLADGSLLAQPAVHAFTTEAAPSLRVAGSDPDDGVEVAPLDVAPAIRFDGPVDPRSLTPGAVTFSNVETGAVVPVEISLTEGQTLLTVRPAAPLAEVTTYGLELAGSIRGTDGSPLARAGSLGAFSTSLAPGLERVEVAPAEVTITRADLSDLRFGVTGVYGDGTRRDLSDPQTSGTFYVVDGAAVDVAGDGAIVPAANGEAIVDVHPLLPGFDTPVRVRVAGVFPEVTFVGRRFDLRADEDVVLAFSERVDTAEVAVDLSSVAVADELGNGVAGAASLSGDGLTLTFDPAGPLPLRRDYTIRFDLALTDGNGLTRVFPRRLRFATAAENLGFELGDFTGFEVEGDVAVVSSFGPLAAPEGDFMARLITSDTAVGGRTSVLRTVDLDVPEGATRLAFTYNFLTDEIEQGSPFNDFFRARLVLPDGTSTTILTVTRDQLRFSGSVSPVPGFDRMTGFRVGSVPVQAGTGPCHLVFETEVSDAGDASIDSAVLIDDIHFQ